MRRLWLWTFVAALLLTVVLALPVAAMARSGDGGDAVPDVFLPFVSIPSDAAAVQGIPDGVVTYLGDVTTDLQLDASQSTPWTRERMLAAQPLSLPLAEGEASRARAAGEEESGDGAPAFFLGAQPQVDARATARRLYPDEWARLDVAQQTPQAEAGLDLPTLPFISYYVTNPAYGGNLFLAEYPWVTMGTFFFTIPGQGDYRCSASVAYERVVWTAGHCVYSPGTGWHTNAVFVPAYQDGSAPFGVFSAYDLATLNPWRDEGNLAYDIGMAALSDLNNQTLGETVGWLGSAFNLPPWRLLYSAFGYPSNLGNNGRYLMSCVGDRWLREDAVGPDPVAIGCDMTSGSSGGPWLIKFYPFRAGDFNFTNGVNSYGYNGIDLMYSPYFGSNAANLYNWGIGE